MATIIDGKAVARALQAEIKDEVEGLKRRWGMSPGLGVVLVGDDPASHLYVKNKEKACNEVEGLKRRWGMSPGLGVVLVGDDPASHLYVKNKEKACKEVGIRSE